MWGTKPLGLLKHPKTRADFRLSLCCRAWTQRNDQRRMEEHRKHMHQEQKTTTKDPKQWILCIYVYIKWKNWMLSRDLSRPFLWDALMRHTRLRHFAGCWIVSSFVKHFLVLSDTVLSSLVRYSTLLPCQTLSCLVKYSLVLSGTLVRYSCLTRLVVRRNIHRGSAHFEMAHIHTYHTCSLTVVSMSTGSNLWQSRDIPSVQCINSTSAAYAEPTRCVGSSPISSLRSSQSSLVELGNNGKATLGNTIQ